MSKLIAFFLGLFGIGSVDQIEEVVKGKVNDLKEDLTNKAEEYKDDLTSKAEGYREDISDKLGEQAASLKDSVLGAGILGGRKEETPVVDLPEEYLKEEATEPTLDDILAEEGVSEDLSMSDTAADDMLEEDLTLSLSDHPDIETMLDEAMDDDTVLRNELEEGIQVELFEENEFAEERPEATEFIENELSDFDTSSDYEDEQ